MILWPFSPVALVFDVLLDTEGDDPLSNDIAQTFHATFLGHLSRPDKSLKISQRPPLKHAQEELEAESLAYLVCQRHGVESKSQSYLADDVLAKTTVGALDLDTLIKAAGQVEMALGIAAETLFAPKPTTNRKATVR